MGANNGQGNGQATAVDYRIHALGDSPAFSVDERGVEVEGHRRILRGLDALDDAESARARNDSEQADRWAGAAEALAGAGLPWEEAYARWRAAQTLPGRGVGGEVRRRSAAMLRRSHSLAVRLGAWPVQEAGQALARSARISLSVVTPPRSNPRQQHGELAKLTPREMEVLAHVVAGRTYAEIASTLFLSEKTVSSHISNILHKTGTANRVELAAWGRTNRRRLVPLPAGPPIVGVNGTSPADAPAPDPH